MEFYRKLAAMTASIDSLVSLELKVDRLIALCDRLSAENADLRGDNSALKTRIDSACERLEILMTRLPEK